MIGNAFTNIYSRLVVLHLNFIARLYFVLSNFSLSNFAKSISIKFGCENEPTNFRVI